jgi:hypothetical protein
MNFTYRGTIGGDSTMQIRLWRQGKKTVAVFDGEDQDHNFWISNRPLPKLTLKSMQIETGIPDFACKREDATISQFTRQYENISFNNGDFGCGVCVEPILASGNWTSD